MQQAALKFIIIRDSSADMHIHQLPRASFPSHRQ